MAEAGRTLSKEETEIIPTGQRMGWLDSISFVEKMGHLPTIRISQSAIGSSGFSNKSLELCPEWNLEIVAHPAVGSTFKKGFDIRGQNKFIEDYNTDRFAKIWTIPASFLPEELFGERGIALLLKSETIDIQNNRVVILPKPSSIELLDFPEKTGTTMLFGHEVFLNRSPEQVVRPVASGLVRDTHRHILYTANKPDLLLGVSYVRQLRRE